MSCLSPLAVRQMALLGLSLVALGCEHRQHVVPVRGKVLYRDQPLKSGSVMFQPEGGIPARGSIGPDGTFSLSTYEPDDGATIGPNKVRIVSTDKVGSNDPTQGELATGESIIPAKYNNFGTTPLTFTVKEPGEENAVLVLDDK